MGGGLPVRKEGDEGAPGLAGHLTRRTGERVDYGKHSGSGGAQTEQGEGGEPAGLGCCPADTFPAERPTVMAGLGGFAGRYEA